MSRHHVNADSLQSLLRSDSFYACIDVRERGEFALMHIAGTTPLARGTLEYRVECMIPQKNIPVVLCCDDGRRSEMAASTLRQMGYLEVKTLAGGLQAWKERALPTRKGWGTHGKEYGEKVAVTQAVPQISARELAERRKQGSPPLLIDVRTEEEFFRGHVPEAYHIPGGELLRELPRLTDDLDAPIVVTCAGRTRSILAARQLREVGFRRVQALHNGAMGWILAGYDLETSAPKKLPNPREKPKDFHEEITGQLIREEQIRFLLPEDLAALQEREEPRYLVDIRLPHKFRQTQLPDSISLPAGQIALAHENFIAVRRASIVLISDDAIQSVWSAALFQRLGFRSVYVLEGGLQGWARRGHALEPQEPVMEIFGLEDARRRVSAMTPAELARVMQASGNGAVIDVRGSGEFATGHISRARWLPRGRLELEIEQMVPDRQGQMVTVCDSGVRSALAAATLHSLGYLKTTFLGEGLKAWKSEGLKLEESLDGAGVSREEAQADFGHTVWKGPLGKTRADMERYLSWEEALGEKYER